ncbi:hypothetical protein [Halalkalibacter nanhaiisediminis]|uniref:Uncharacterized protein n=1 Tax=Halalkalibacter nanhaiisediminis TaxID=688079 RepID=A0A562QKB9_9BACI|nr:hypothetical protein [Halalkalibacter nanhaiisediminis]TWI57207.1 hypothetical protein IQ10_01913 [Halalkalibacter nanhaiisediminis]
MRFMRNKHVVMFLSVIALLFVLVGCGSSEEESAGEITLVNEQGEEVTLTNKERATILFHFTEVG